MRRNLWHSPFAAALIAVAAATAASGAPLGVADRVSGDLGGPLEVTLGSKGSPRGPLQGGPPLHCCKVDGEPWGPYRAAG